MDWRINLRISNWNITFILLAAMEMAAADTKLLQPKRNTMTKLNEKVMFFIPYIKESLTKVHII